MKISIISMGKPKDSPYQDLVTEYQSRLSRFCTLEEMVVNTTKFQKLPPIDQQRKEAVALHERTPKNAFLVVLDERGSEFTSQEFAELIEARSIVSGNTLTFALGGPLGWVDEVRQEADLCFSLSKLTFPFQLARVVLLEQIYRAFTILRNIEYHK